MLSKENCLLKSSRGRGNVHCSLIRGIRDMATLADVGVDFVQDFLLGRSKTVKDLPDRLKERYPNATTLKKWPFISMWNWANKKKWPYVRGFPFAVNSFISVESRVNPTRKTAIYYRAGKPYVGRLFISWIHNLSHCSSNGTHIPIKLPNFTFRIARENSHIIMSSQVKSSQKHLFKHV